MVECQRSEMVMGVLSHGPNGLVGGSHVVNDPIRAQIIVRFAVEQSEQHVLRGLFDLHAQTNARTSVRAWGKNDKKRIKL